MAVIVYLLEADIDRAKQIVDTFLQSGYQVEPVSELEELSDFIQKKVPDAVYLGYPWIQNKMNQLAFLKPHFSIVYGEDIDIDLKIQLYKIGISRVVSWENGAQYLLEMLRLFNYRQKELKPHIQKNITRGDMREFRLKDMLLSNVPEKRNFIIKISDRQWSAKLRIYQGEIIEALCPGKEGIEAALTILQHNSGTFRLQSYQKPEEVSTSDASTYAVLLESDIEAQYYQEFIDQLGIINPIFSLSQKHNLDSLSDDEKSLIEVVKKHKNLDEILQNCSFGLLKTIRIIDNLYQRGVITVDLEEVNLTRFTEQDINYIQENIFGPQRNEGRLIVLGFPGSGRGEIIQTLANTHQSEIKNIQDFDFTKIQINGKLKLNVFGISVDTHFQPVLKKLSSDMLACIFLIDYTQPDKYEYANYLVQQFLSNYKVPLVIGVTNIQQNPTHCLGEVREKLEIPRKVRVLPLNPEDFHQIRQLLYALKK